LPSSLTGKKPKAAEYAIKPNSPATLQTLLRDHQSENVVASNLVIGFATSISARDESITTFLDDSVRFQNSCGLCQDDIADPKLSIAYGLDVEHFSMLNRRDHASTPGLKAKAEPTFDEFAGELLEQERLGPVLDHCS
jgi:hypothetical protein